MTADSTRSFRIGLVGCGRISKNHFDAIAGVEGGILTVRRSEEGMFHTVLIDEAAGNHIVVIDGEGDCCGRIGDRNDRHHFRGVGRQGGGNTRHKQRSAQSVHDFL